MDFPPRQPGIISRLAANRLFSSGDLDETRSTVGRIFKPHNLRIDGSRQKLNARIDHIPIGQVSINRLRYGANVTIEPECLDDFLLVQMPIAGQAHICCGTQSIVSTPKKASVITPSQPLHMRWQQHNDQLIVRLERQALEDACRTLIGHALPRPLEYQLGMSLNKGYGQAWRQLVNFLANSAFISGAGNNPLVTVQIEQLLIGFLLGNHPHNYSDILRQPAKTPSRRYVRQAEEFIREHCNTALSLKIIANHVNISSRSLHYGFKEHFGMGPMAFLKLVRLQKVRQVLLEARKNSMAISISSLALNWGFSHLGHFSQDYRKQYGETPSQTLGRE